MDHPTRRRLIRALAGVGLAATAGCLDGGGGGNDATTTTDGGDGGDGGGGDGGGGDGGGGDGGGGDGGGGDGGGDPGTTTTSPATTTVTRTYTAPETKFSFVFAPDDGVLLMANSGVEGFTEENTERLVIVVDGEEAKEWELPCEPGDKNRVAASRGATVELVWIAPSGKEKTVATYEIPSS